MLGLTPDGDLDRPPGASVFCRVDGEQQCLQHLRTRLRLFTREVFRDQRIGVQYLEIVTQPGYSANLIANHIASVALATPGVVSCQLTYDLEPVRGVVSLELAGQFQLADQTARVPFHETMQVAIGGSIQT